MAQSVRCRIRLPAGGDSSKATSITQDSDTTRAGINYFPAKEWSIDDDVLNLSDTASVSIANNDGENSGKFQVGQRVEIDLSDPDVASGTWCRQFTGRITQVRTYSDLQSGSNIMLSMMDLGWHLVNTHAPPLKRIKEIRFSKLLELLIDPSWGFAKDSAGKLIVQGSNDLNRRLKHGRQVIIQEHKPVLGAILPFIQTEPGQTPFDILRLYAQRDGFLVNVGARGDLIIFRPSYDDQSFYRIHYHKSSEPSRTLNNVIGQPAVSQSIDGVYTSVTCFSTVVIPPEIANTENPNEMYRSNVFTPRDEVLPFIRDWVVSDGEAINQKLRTNRAKWTWQMGIFNSWSYEVEVPGVSMGEAFLVSDTMCTVDDTVNKVSGAYYVQSVRKSSTLQGGLKTSLRLRIPGLLNPELGGLGDGAIGGGAKKAAKYPAPIQ